MRLKGQYEGPRTPDFRMMYLYTCTVPLLTVRDIFFRVFLCLAAVGAEVADKVRLWPRVPLHRNALKQTDMLLHADSVCLPRE